MNDAFAGAQRVPDRRLDLLIRRDFLTKEECGGLIALIERQRRPSTIVDANGDPTYRTSETCDLDPADAFVATIDARICTYARLSPDLGEPIQGQRYDVGQEFKAHTDYFEPNGVDYLTHCAITGQRTWTVMIYLNVPAAGGATRFRTIDNTVQPETGKLLAWNNLLPNGQANYATLHQGMKVRAGVKYIITKWFRERVAVQAH